MTAPESAGRAGASPEAADPADTTHPDELTVDPSPLRGLLLALLLGVVLWLALGGLVALAVFVSPLLAALIACAAVAAFLGWVL